jgi:hypothetical protein
VPAEKPPNRHPAGGDLARLQHGAELVQCQLRLLARQAEQLCLVIDALPPRGLAAISPLARQRCTQRIAELALTLNCLAAACRVTPASIVSITRSRKSPEYNFGIPTPNIEGHRIAHPQLL